MQREVRFITLFVILSVAAVWLATTWNIPSGILTYVVAFIVISAVLIFSLFLANVSLSRKIEPTLSELERELLGLFPPAYTDEVRDNPRQISPDKVASVIAKLPNDSEYDRIREILTNCLPSGIVSKADTLEFLDEVGRIK